MNRRAIARRLGRLVLAVAFVGLVAVFVIMAAPWAIGAEHSYVVLTNSMEPAIGPGDAVVVGDVAPEDVSVGDVITFHREANQPPVTHRVTEVISDDGGIRFRTAGDNNEDVDPWTVPADALVGEVWFTIPLIGHVVQFGNTPAGAAVLIGFPIALFVLSELWAQGDGVAVTRGDGGGESPAPDSAVIPRFEDPEATADGDDAVTVSPTELRLGALGFGTFAVYAVYVALGTTNGVTVGVAVGATVAALAHLAGLALLVVGDEGEAVAADDSAPVVDVADHPGGGADD